VRRGQVPARHGGCGRRRCRQRLLHLLLLPLLLRRRLLPALPLPAGGTLQDASANMQDKAWQQAGKM
jgi:hypothetical protein